MISGIIDDPDGLRRKKENARKLAAAVIEPEVAVKPLVRMMEGLVVDGATRMYFMTPTFRPVGGVVKVLDYVNHARSLGYSRSSPVPSSTNLGCPSSRSRASPASRRRTGSGSPSLEKVSVAPHELAFLSWPTHYEILEPRLSRWTRHEQVIFIVQNVRWANPTFTNGYAVRLLSRPMARIMTNDVVLEAVKPYLNPSSITEVIQLGNDSDFFARKRSGGLGSPVKVGYTTWKSGVGDEVAASLARLAGVRVSGDPGPGRLGRAARALPLGRRVPRHAAASRRVSTCQASRRWPRGRS